ncbi:MAG: hypothetical protein H8D23_17755 [Candidatus Brocadiales bacterium]|nr:hypothetical protein [Candidatus Brocadiales bacterium]
MTDKQTSGPINGMEFISEGSITIPGRTPKEDRAERDDAGYDDECPCYLQFDMRNSEMLEQEEERSAPVRISWDDF